MPEGDSSTEHGLSDRRKKAEELFQVAVNLSAEQRAAFLDEQCGRDTALRREVERLLVADNVETADFPGPPPVGQLVQPGERIDKYVIREQIGEGGFAIVYAAEQEKPVRRKVALKIIKPGMDTKQVIARFEAERQALAMMDHPNVAKVFDAGATETGRPYFVMEHVPGVSITMHCDRQRLSIQERLELFIQVCHAVQHAHQKGIIHRDIKPSNVLVLSKDGTATPKVIDFGVAKAISHRLTERTIYTEQGQLIGTPEYMSPEQAEMTGQDIDTRSDIYSLGVVLYELLTGALPFDPTTLRRAAFGEIQRIIREQEPPKPSTRLSSLGDDSATSAKRRQVDPKSLLRELRGDLDWIVMKALEKDRSRRYETANGLAMDLRRHLDHEPVQAGPPSAAYKLSKFVRRNRAVVAAAALVAVSLIAAAAVSVGFAVSEAEQRAIADRARARQLRLQQQADTISGFLETMLSAVDPQVAKGQDVTVLRQVLDQAAGSIDREFDGHPLAEARLRHTIGNTYAAIGLYDEAAPHLSWTVETRNRLLGEESPETLESLVSLAALSQKQGRYQEAERLSRQALETRRRVLGDQHLDTMAAANALASVYEAQGKFAEAEPLFLETLKNQRQALGREDPGTLRTLSGLALLYERTGRLEEAEQLHLAALAGKRLTLGEEDPETLLTMNNLGLLYLGQGRLEEAEQMFLETLDVRRRVQGQAHQDTIGTLGNLAGTYLRAGRSGEAESLFVQVLQLQRDTLGDTHPDTLSSIANVGSVYVTQGRYAEAEPLLVEAMNSQAEVLGETHPDTLRTMTSLGALLIEQKRYDEAEPVLIKALELHRSALGDEHQDTLIAMANLGQVYAGQERYSEARPVLADAVEIAKRSLTAEHWLTGILQSIYGSCLAGLEEFEEAEKTLLEAHRVLETVFGRENEWTTRTLTSTAMLYESWGRPERAAEFRSMLPPEAQGPTASD